MEKKNQLFNQNLSTAQAKKECISDPAENKGNTLEIYSICGLDTNTELKPQAVVHNEKRNKH